MNLELDDKVVLIVGASAGIGAATARLLVVEGARVALVARRTSELAKMAAQMGGAAGNVLTFTGDAADSGFLEGAVAGTTQRFGALHRLVVVAGPMGARADVLALNDDDWNRYFQQSTMVAVRACRSAIPELLKHSGAAIVLTSAYSIRAQKPELIAYTAMKSTIPSISKNLAKAYGHRGLRVNCIAPGVIEKDFDDSETLAKRYGVSKERARYEFVRREFGMSVALERAGRHDEFADLIVYLLSARASYITGATINADGGTDF
jgi:NAD(P)-dependent dehydrogenase (short-subunit alcohol dehydrogenase family)